MKRRAARGIKFAQTSRKRKAPPRESTVVWAPCRGRVERHQDAVDHGSAWSGAHRPLGRAASPPRRRRRRLRSCAEAAAVAGSRARDRRRAASPVVGAERRRSDVVDPDPRHPVAAEGEKLGGLLGDVDQAIADIGPAVVDAHGDRAVVLEVGHAHVAGQRQRQMRGGKRQAVEGLAVGGRAAVELEPYQEASPTSL